ncbi:zf-HC2 domain-containing protein [Symbiobacterium thermophilum]
MQIDLCALTEDLLPLYADDLLSPATRQLLEQHAAACPACRERLRAAGIQHPPPAPTDLPRLERPARAFFRRLSGLRTPGWPRWWRSWSRPAAWATSPAAKASTTGSGSRSGWPARRSWPGRPSRAGTGPRPTGW